MLAKVRRCTAIRLEGVIAEVEVDVSSGLPEFIVAGLPDTAVFEAREPVTATVRNSGFTFPMKKAEPACYEHCLSRQRRGLHFD